MAEGERLPISAISHRVAAEHALRPGTGRPVPRTPEQKRAEMVKHKLGEREQRLAKRDRDIRARKEVQQWWKMYHAEREAKKKKG